MEFIIIILTVLILFFVLRTNYKLSEHEEKTRQVMDEDLRRFASINEELLQRITSVENKIAFYQNQLNDIMSESNSQNNQRNRRIAKELEQIKSDTDIIKSLHLKRSVKRPIEKHEEEKSFSQETLKSTNIKKKTTILQDNKVEQKTIETIKQVPRQHEAKEPVKKVEKIKNSTEDEIFKKTIEEKIGSLTIDDVVILKQIFNKPNAIWFKGTDIDDDQTKIPFALPKLSRKLIVDGVPVVKIKTVRDKMMIMWGESLTDSKVKITLNAIRGEM